MQVTAELIDQANNIEHKSLTIGIFVQYTDWLKFSLAPKTIAFQILGRTRSCIIIIIEPARKTTWEYILKSDYIDILIQSKPIISHP